MLSYDFNQSAAYLFITDLWETRGWLGGNGWQAPTRNS